MKKDKPVLFLDFDGLKFDTLGIHVNYINKKYGVKTIPSDYTNNPSLETVIKKYLLEDQHHLITKEEVYVDIGENLNGSLEWHAEVLPMEGVEEVVPLLAKKYTLWTVTARQTACIPVIMYLLNKYIPHCISGIHCVWEHIGDGQFKGIPKRDFVANFNGEKIAFIDDSALEILDMQDMIPSYLFDPHGLNDMTPNIHHRVRSWQEIGDTFL
jgi:hypothetical protein